MDTVLTMRWCKSQMSCSVPKLKQVVFTVFKASVIRKAQYSSMPLSTPEYTMFTSSRALAVFKLQSCGGPIQCIVPLHCVVSGCYRTIAGQFPRLGGLIEASSQAAATAEKVLWRLLAMDIGLRESGWQWSQPGSPVVSGPGQPTMQGTH